MFFSCSIPCAAPLYSACKAGTFSTSFKLPGYPTNPGKTKLSLPNVLLGLKYGCYCYLQRLLCVILLQMNVKSESLKGIGVAFH